MSRSVNVAIIIGNLTRDPEMRYTPQGHAVTSFGVATNRRWVSEGVEKEEAEFHNVVAWNKLAELCSSLLHKGTKVYIQGRLQTRSWQGADGAKRSRTEIVAEDMVVLDSRRGAEGGVAEKAAEGEPAAAGPAAKSDLAAEGEARKTPSAGEESTEDIPTEEIPF